MNKDILSVVNTVSNEKLISKEKIFNALEIALSTATKKKYLQKINIKIVINKKTGDYKTFRRWLIVNKVLFPTKEITLDAVKLDDCNAVVGNYIEEEISSVKFDRITIQSAKQVIIQKIKEAELLMLIKKFKSKKGKIISGIVKIVKKDLIILEVEDNINAYIKRDELIPYENFRKGDYIRGILYLIKLENNEIQLYISRSRPDMLKELLKIEIPEIKKGIIIIKNIVRDPNLRSKIAVISNDSKIDPIGACIGLRGIRIKSVSKQLNNERIDIILWDNNPIQFIINAMFPINIISIILNNNKHYMDLGINNINLSKAIGRNGLNIKLISKISNWELNIMKIEDLNKKIIHQNENLLKMFINCLHVNNKIALFLIKNGFSSLEDIVNTPLKNFLNKNLINKKKYLKIKYKAKKKLLNINNKFKIKKNNKFFIKKLNK